jgi:hypothetical protein
VGHGWLEIIVVIVRDVGKTGNCKVWYPRCASKLHNKVKYTPSMQNFTVTIVNGHLHWLQQILGHIANLFISHYYSAM